ncbi:hypothetical protein FBU30_008906 [Linnemannia zychae]|nr:hypothetical protein FBU30_008906 [Linnemannia zychae]
MTQFTDMVSKFASASDSNSKKRTIITIDDDDDNIKLEESPGSSSASTAITELPSQVRKSLRLTSSSGSRADTPGPFVSRTISADSVKTRPHHKRVTVVEVTKKEETTTVRRGTQGRSPGYASPATYAHLDYVPDIIDYDLDVLFVGINPGVRTSERGHHYSGLNNHFWPCLSESGLLPPGVRLGPEDDQSLPALTNMGLTNLIDRPSRMGNELSDAECRAAAPNLTAKIKKYRPRFVCFVSKQAWDMYTGVGLGLQTAWVSWDDTPEDEELFGADHEDKENPIQMKMNEEGYRLAPYLADGPAAQRLDAQLKAEGAPSPYVKREDGSMAIKTEVQKEEGDVDSKKNIKMEVDDVKPIKEELDDELSIKKELDDDNTDHKFTIKKEMDNKAGIKQEIDNKAEIKKEINNKVGVKQEIDDKSAIKSEISSSSAAPKRSRYRGGVRGSRMFVMPSTSGRVTQYRREDKLAFFKQLAELVRKDRQIRGVKAPWEQ